MIQHPHFMSYCRFAQVNALSPRVAQGVGWSVHIHIGFNLVFHCASWLNKMHEKCICRLISLPYYNGAFFVCVRALYVLGEKKKATKTGLNDTQKRNVFCFLLLQPDYPELGGNQDWLASAVTLRALCRVSHISRLLSLRGAKWLLGFTLYIYSPTVKN